MSFIYLFHIVIFYLKFRFVSFLFWVLMFHFPLRIPNLSVNYIIAFSHVTLLAFNLIIVIKLEFHFLVKMNKLQLEYLKYLIWVTHFILR